MSSGRNITLLKLAKSGVLSKVVSGGQKYLQLSGRAGKGVARAVGAGEVGQGLGTAAGVAGGVVAPVLLARQTRVGRKAERVAGKAMGTAGRLSERALTPGNWGAYAGETF